MLEEKKKFQYSVTKPILFLFLLFFIESIKSIFDLNLVPFGVFPREVFGLVGIVTAPLIHSNFEHLFTNTFPLLVLGTSIIYFYPESSKKTLPIIYFVPSMFVWAFARESYHIGASGIVYGLAAFVFFSGVIRKDRRAITLTLLTIFLYSGIIVGLFPTKVGVSWESHLFGFLTGLVLAVLFRKNDPYKKYDWEDEESTENIRDLKISHRK